MKFKIIFDERMVDAEYKKMIEYLEDKFGYYRMDELKDGFKEHSDGKNYTVESNSDKEVYEFLKEKGFLVEQVK